VAGHFIVLEGIDGVGKTTQVALLAEWLRAIEVPHLTVREPGGTPLGEAIRELVLGRPELEVGPRSEMFLILAARAALVGDVLRPALREGRTVIADRFALSTLAYQGYGRGIDVGQVRRAVEVATDGLSADLCIVLDLPLAEAQARLDEGGDEPDRIEREAEAFRVAVRNGYLALARSEPNVEVVSAEGTPDAVHSRVRGLLEARFPQTFLRLSADVG
jgi:dTMP kinase